MIVRHRSWWLHVLRVGIAVVTIAACGGSVPVSSSLSAGIDVPVHIVVLGSSTAYGIGPRDRSNIWVSRYRTYLQSLNPQNDVVNLAVPGFSTYEVLPTAYEPPPRRPPSDPEHNVTQALASRPSAIIVNLPSNDVARGYSVGEQMQNYRMLRDAAAAAGVALWLTTPQPRNLDETGRGALQELRRAMQQEFGSRLIDFWTGIAAGDGSIPPEYDSGDGIHLNDAAHAILAGRVVESAILASIQLQSAMVPAWALVSRSSTLRRAELCDAGRFLPCSLFPSQLLPADWFRYTPPA